MYYLIEKSDGIKELQRYLSFIAELPVTINGIYDDQTSRVVQNFKFKNDLTADSSVDRKTFDKIYNAFREKEREREQNKSINDFRYGVYSSAMILFNEMLSFTMNNLGLDNSIRHLPFYTEETNAAVLTLSKVFNISEEDFSVSKFIDRLKIEYESIITAKKYINIVE